MSLPEIFNVSELVRFVGHPDHVAPPILKVGGPDPCGYVVEQRQDGLYLIQFDDITPALQVHADQLELVQSTDKRRETASQGVHPQKNALGSPESGSLEASEHSCPWCPLEVRDLAAIAHNVVVNQGTERFAKKMRALEEKVNAIRPELAQHFAEVKGEEEPTPCIDGCRIRAGGFFHAEGCPNDWRSK